MTLGTKSETLSSMFKHFSFPFAISLRTQRLDFVKTSNRQIDLSTPLLSLLTSLFMSIFSHTYLCIKGLKKVTLLDSCHCEISVTYMDYGSRTKDLW